MQLNEYQYLAKKTAIYPSVLILKKPLSEIKTMKDLYDNSNELNLVYPALGSAGEAGEFAEKVKKVIRDKHGELDEDTKKQLSKELGDKLWYLAACATELGIMLDDVAKENIQKLNDRQSRGVLSGSGDNR